MEPMNSIKVTANMRLHNSNGQIDLPHNFHGSRQRGQTLAYSLMYL